jgi:hypothetical protein
LKTELIQEVARYKISLVNIDQYTDLKEELSKVSRPNLRNFSLEESYTNDLKRSIDAHNKSITRIIQLETKIKSINPYFKSLVP